MTIDFDSENWDEQMHAEDVGRLRSASYYILGTVDADGNLRVSSLPTKGVSNASITHLCGAIRAEVEHLLYDLRGDDGLSD
jgi:hypothetical protein